MTLSGDGRIHERSRATGLLEQDGQRRDLEIPLDEGGTRARARERMVVERPYLRSDPRAMVVDEDGDAVGVVDAVPGHMELFDGSGRQRVDIRDRVEAEIDAGHVDVVDVAQEPTAGPARDLGEERGLG